MTEQTPLPSGFIDACQARFTAPKLLIEAAACWPYGVDNSRHHRAPQLVLLADSHADVEALVILCNQYRVPLTARGRGTNTTGAAVPLRGGAVLSLERLLGMQPVDAANRLVRVAAGTLNQDLQHHVGQAGFFWPPDPTSAAFCTVGGNLACNAAGPRAVKYGTCRENTLGLRAVTGAGETIEVGVKTTKGVVGLDLTRLLIGSEGTLAIITEATLKLTPLARRTIYLRALYDEVAAAADAIAAIMAQPETPAMLEFVDAAGLALIREQPGIELPAGANAMLMLAADGSAQAIGETVAAIRAAASVTGCLSIDSADSAAEVERLLAARKALSPALRKLAPQKINEDVVVPVSRIPELVDGLRAISAQFGIPIVNFGHGGNGNLHTNLLIAGHDARQQQNAPACLAAVFDLVLRLDGTLSGEHGIGYVKREYVSRELDAGVIALNAAIKAQFDPHGILNPGKGY